MILWASDKQTHTQTDIETHRNSNLDRHTVTETEADSET